MGGAEVTQALAMLANERRVSVSTRNQALSALLVLYREVLAVDLPWLPASGVKVIQLGFAEAGSSPSLEIKWSTQAGRCVF